MKKYFPYVDNNYNKPDETQDIVTIVENMSEKEPENEKIEKTHQIIKKYDTEQDDSLEREFLLESFKKNFQNELLVFFDKFLETFGEFLNSLGIKTYKDILGPPESFWFFKINVLNDLSKYRLNAIKENLERKTVDIFMKNSFQSFGNLKKNLIFLYFLYFFRAK